MTAGLSKLTILAAAAVDPGKYRTAIPLALAIDAGPDAGHGLTAPGWNLVAAHLAVESSLARRQAGTRGRDSIAYGCIDLILYRAFIRPTGCHRYLPPAWGQVTVIGNWNGASDRRSVCQ